MYVPFTDIGAASLRMLAATREITITDEDAADLTDQFATIPPHREVPAALRRLREHENAGDTSRHPRPTSRTTSAATSTIADQLIGKYNL